MSDFLTNLLTRSFSQAGSVRPLFEPVGASTRGRAQVDPVLEVSDEFSDSFAEVPVAENDVALEQEVRPAVRRAVRRVSAAPARSEPEPAETKVEIGDATISSREPLSTPRSAASSSAQTSAAAKETPAQMLAAGETPKSKAGVTSFESATPAASLGAQLMRKPASETPPRDVLTQPPKRVLQRRVAGEDRSANVRDVSSTEPIPVVPIVTRRSPRETLFSPTISKLHSDSRDAATPHDEHAPIVEHIVERIISQPLTATSGVLPARTFDQQQQSSALPPPIVPKIRTMPLPLNAKSRTDKPVNTAPAELAIEPTAPETVVHVAIGRIEVRATSPATTKRERRTPGPKIMTLDDYVNQRSRGSQ